MFVDDYKHRIDTLKRMLSCVNPYRCRTRSIWLDIL